MRIAVAMSGGVDSSVAAALLQREGHEVQGIFMKNWSPETIQSLTDCPWEADQADAAAVCEHLGLPFRSINFEREYKDRVVDYFIKEYAAGRTPNPDIMCNKEIKFRAFLEVAKDLGADRIATGHYAQVEESGGRFVLRRGVDPGKDQSYFLYSLSEQQLSHSLFPVGALPKSHVRTLAAEFDLPTAQKKDSQGICFIGHIDLKKFLMEEIAVRPGESYLLPPAEGLSWAERLGQAYPVGHHAGVMYYTIGERAGSAVDNGAYRKLRAGADIPPLYVVEKDLKANRLYLAEQHDDRDLLVQELVVGGWSGEVDGPNLRVQIRYQEKDPAEIASLQVEGGFVRIRAERPVWAPAVGQATVVYSGDRVVGGGVLEEVVRS